MSILGDLKYAARSLRRSPGFTIAGVLTLALGIGANTAIFTLLDGVMFKPLPLDRPNELVLLHETNTDGQSDLQGGTGPAARFSNAQFQRLSEAAGPDVPLAAMTRVVGFNARLAGGEQYERVRVQLVSERFFDTFAIQSVLGRLLTSTDNEQLDAHPVAVISHSFWQRRLGGAQDAVGRAIAVNNVPLTIVGVAAPGFDGVWSDTPVDAWIPRVMQHSVQYRQNVSASNSDVDEPWSPQIGISWLVIVGRVPPPRRAAFQAAATAAHRAGILELADVEGNPVRRAAILARGLGLASFERGFSGLRPQFAGALRLLMGLVVAVLLIACVNLANLLLARASSRRRELATRLALGASRGRLVAQLLVECAVLAAIGGVVGVLTGQWITTLVAAMLDQPAFPTDPRVLAFAFLVTLATVAVSGLMPALHATRLELATRSRSPAASTEAGGSIRGMRPLLVVQVAFSCALVVAAALFGRTLLNLSMLDPGFDREHLVTVSINPRISGYSTQELPLLYGRLDERLRTVRGVEAVALASGGLPFIGSSTSGVNSIEGFQPAPGELPRIETRWIGPRYFSTVGMALREGREFDERDLAAPEAAVIVNDAAVRRFFAGQSPLGKRFSIGPSAALIVGVVQDARTGSLLTTPVATAFLLLGTGVTAGVVQARVTGDAATAAAAIRDAIARAEPRLVIGSVDTVEAAIDRNVLPQRLVAYLTSGFALLALLLACVGLYGVLSYSVVRRTAELGIRAAVGARPANLLRLILGDGLSVVAIGLVLGVGASLASARAVETLLFGIDASDPSTYAAVVVVLLAAAIAACYIPARRASRVDPAMALRAD